MKSKSSVVVSEWARKNAPASRGAPVGTRAMAWKLYGERAE